MVFMEKFITFICFIVGDLVIFGFTILCMLWLEKPRSSRMVKVSNERICRPKRKKRDRRIWRHVWLWVLYWQGTHPELCQIGLHAALAAHVPNADRWDEFAGENNIDEVLCLMSFAAQGNQPHSGFSDPAATPLLDNPEVVEQMEDFDGQIDAESDTESTEGSDGEALQTEEPHMGAPEEDQCVPQEQPSDAEGYRGVDSPDWNNVFQFRRHFSMRHCFVRWTSYRNIISGIAHTWEVSQDDVYAVHDMAVHPPGIVATSQPVIVQIWGDDLPHEVGMSVLVDLEIYLPASYRESHIRDRHVRKFPQHVTRFQILQNAFADAICESRHQRCLVRHNNVLRHLQSNERYEARHGDYFLIQVPPLEDCILPQPQQPHAMALLQQRFRLQKIHSAKSIWLQAPGNAEEATRDLDHLDYEGMTFYNTTTPLEATQGYRRSPIEGLPDPGNPLQIPEVFDLTKDEDAEAIAEAPCQLDMTITLPQDNQNIIRLLQPWDAQALKLDFDPECDLTPISLQYLSGCQVGGDSALPVHRLYIYTDGSYNGHLQTAAFAFAVFGWSETNPHHHFYGWFGDKVRTSNQDNNFTGAEYHTAEEAEATGIIFAHIWYLQAQPNIPATFCFDSVNCGLGASGMRNVRSNWGQGTKMRELTQFLTALCPQHTFCYEHIKAHSGHPANDTVDCLAKWLTTADSSLQHTLLPDWRPLFDRSDQTLAWAWWLAKSLLRDPTLPPMVNGHHEWTLQDPCHRAPDVHSIEQRQTTVSYGTIFDLRCATFNVLSLEAYERKNGGNDTVIEGSAALLRQQFQQGGYHLIGLQETRSSAQTLLRTTNFFRFISGDTDGSGHGGCELWISRTITWANTSEGKISVKDKDVAIFVATPRLLGATIRVGREVLVVYVCHAPHEGASKECKDEWWTNFRLHLQKHRHKGRHILLGDFNARMDLQVPGHVGDRVFGSESDNSHRFQELLQDHSLWLPSTYSDYHTDLDWTWIHPKGTPARIDYVVLDADYAWQICWSAVDSNIQATHRAMDHSVVGLRVKWFCETSQRQRKRLSIDWDAMHTPEGSAKLDHILDNMPRVPWEEDVHQHWQILQEHLDQGLVQHFPLSKSPTRADIFTEETWIHLRMRQRWKSRLIEWDHQLLRFKQQIFLVQWRHNATAEMVKCRFQLELSAIYLLRTFLLQCFRKAAGALRQSVKSDKAAYIDSVVDTANAANTQDIHHRLKPLRINSMWRKKPRCPLPLLRDQDEQAVTDVRSIDDLWRDHCARLEAGTITTTKRLLQRTRKKSFQRAQQQPHSFLEDAPTLTALEAAFRRIKCRKSAGNDQIRSDLCHLKPASLAHCYFPILAKLYFQLMEPIQMKGGTMVSAYKGGNSSNIENFRGLLLSSHVGKAIRRTVRQQLTHYYTSTAPATHFSIRLGGNVAHASFTLRTFLQAASNRGWSTATLFLDIKSAFYRVVRQLATQISNTDEDFCRVLAYFEIDPEDMADLWDEIRQPSECQTSDIPHRLEAVLEELMSGTWFTTSSQRHLVEVMAGSRPGDGLADIVFGFIFKRILARVREALQQYVEWWQEESEQIYGYDLREAPPQPPPRNTMEVIWADDLAFSVAGTPATVVTERIGIAAKEIINLCLRHAMQPNLKRGKTEILFCLKGPQSRQLKRDIFGGLDPDFFIPEAPANYQRIKVTAQYKHLGSQLHVTTKMLPELRVRMGQAAAIFRKHRRAVFQNPRLTLCKRRFLFNSLVNSVLTFNAGTWPQLSQTEHKYFQTRLYSMYRSLARATVPEQELRLWNHRRLLAFVEMPSAQLLLRSHRLRFALTLGKSAPTEIWHLLATEQNWLGLLRSDFEWMQAQLQGWGPDKHGNKFLLDMDHMIKHPSRAASTWIRKAVRHEMMQDKIWSAWLEWHHDMMLELGMAGLDVAFPWIIPETVKQRPRQQQEEACLHCGLRFKNRAAWAVHAFRVHGRINDKRYILAGTRCEHCMKEYKTSRRLLHHLIYSTACSEALQRAGHFVAPGPGRNNTKEDRGGVFPVPVTRAQGPQRLWPQPLQGQLPHPDHDDDLMDQMVQVLENITTMTSIEEGAERLIQVIRQSTLSYRAVRYNFDQLLDLCRRDGTWITEAIPDEQLQRMMDLTDEYCTLDLLLPQDDSETWSPEELRSNAWDFCQNFRTVPRWTRAARYVPRFIAKELVFVHLFSGARRPGDVQSHWETMPIPSSCIRIILSVDIIFDAVRANLSLPEVQRQWLTFIRSGCICVLVVGPPCESWSKAREKGGIPGHLAGDGGPRLLRSADSPAALPSLKLDELGQLQLANSLLCFALQAFLYMLMAHRLALLEHPAKPEGVGQDWLPSIWKLGIVKLLASHEAVNIVEIWQGHFGAKSPKPTSLLISAGNINARDAIYHCACRADLPSPLQMGYDTSTREYSTASLKEYPDALCAGIANLTNLWCSEYVRKPDIQSTAMAPFLEYSAQLQRHLNQVAQRGADFARN